MNESNRVRLLREATRAGIQDHGIIPLYFPINTWAVRKSLRLRTRSDGATLAMNVSATRVP